MIKRELFFLTGSRGFSKLVDSLDRVSGSRADRLAILTYHRVDTADANPGLDPSLISASPTMFEQQIAFLKKTHHVISLDDLLAVSKNGGRLPARSVMVTFDDAYQDFSVHAWPVLKRYEIPVTLFVPTAFPDHPERMFWWDRLYRAIGQAQQRGDLSTPVGVLAMGTPGQRMDAYRRLKRYVKSLPHDEAMRWVDQLCCQLGESPAESSVLGWDRLRELAQEGVTLGAHTRNHPLMHRMPLENAICEATESLRDLNREIGNLPSILAYPGGGISEAIKKGLRREGFTLAFTTQRRGNNLRHPEWLSLSRINVGRHTTLPLLRLQLLISTYGEIFFRPSAWTKGRLL